MNEAQEVYAKFVDELQVVDDLAQIVLKGHLVLEEIMSEAIETFVHHGEKIQDARLQFSQKVKICRSMSLNEQDNPMWDLLQAINTLRNQMSHSLDRGKRERKVDSLVNHFDREFPELKDNVYDGMSKEASICLMSISTSIGYLKQFEAEVVRFRSHVDVLDEMVNKGSADET